MTKIRASIIGPDQHTYSNRECLLDEDENILKEFHNTYEQVIKKYDQVSALLVQANHPRSEELSEIEAAHEMLREAVFQHFINSCARFVSEKYLIKIEPFEPKKIDVEELLNIMTAPDFECLPDFITFDEMRDHIEAQLPAGYLEKALIKHGRYIRSLIKEDKIEFTALNEEKEMIFTFGMTNFVFFHGLTRVLHFVANQTYIFDNPFRDELIMRDQSFFDRAEHNIGNDHLMEFRVEGEALQVRIKFPNPNAFDKFYYHFFLT